MYALKTGKKTFLWNSENVSRLLLHLRYPSTVYVRTCVHLGWERRMGERYCSEVLVLKEVGYALSCLDLVGHTWAQMQTKVLCIIYVIQSTVARQILNKLG